MELLVFRLSAPSITMSEWMVPAHGGFKASVGQASRKALVWRLEVGNNVAC
jgi:hypothetical protein